MPEFKLVVEVCRAANLMPKDGEGTSSPFVMVDFDGQRQKTTVKSKDLNPVWNEKLEFKDLLDVHSQLDRTEAQCHELVKNENKLKKQLKYEDSRFQKVNASYSTVKKHSNGIAAKPRAGLPSMRQNSSSSRRNWSKPAGRVRNSQTNNEVLSKEKEAMGSLASTSQISQVEIYVHVHLPPLPDMPDIPTSFQHDEEHQGPAPGALDVRSDIDQNIEDMPEGPAKEISLT
ncbi:hypothetical protein L7F22_032402 [Adiantum nelumboides]|nr:hypothetical protein [Adiantum nelumboides]